MSIKLNTLDFSEVIVYGVECPKCGEWIQVDNISDIEDYVCECNSSFELEEEK